MVTQQIFLERLVRGEIIPFLGSEIHLLSNPTINSPDEVALKLAEVLKFPNFAGTLPMICQYYQMEHDRSSLLVAAKTLVGNECTDMQENPIFHLLGEIRSPLLILSSLYDNGLEKVFEKKGKPFVMISHHLQPGSDYGKVILKYSDKGKREEPCSTEALSGCSFLEEGRSVIYKICGCYSLCDENEIDQVDSLMISEEDFFNFLIQIEKVIPAYLVRRFSKRSLLFLGYNLNNWHDRLIATAILEKKRMYRERSYAIRRNPDRYEKAFWNYFKVEVQETGLWEYIQIIQERLPELKTENAVKIPRFDVFLCHNSKDKPFVKEIGGKLKEKGLIPWLDIEQLRPGFPWQRVLEEQIENVKAVAVFIGEKGIGPWQNMEQEAFIRQFIKRNCPVIPVILPECAEEPKLPVFLSGMMCADFRKNDPDPLGQLIWGITGSRPG
ncbi:MAG: TIR domain-containing protein [Desulfococcaceae bacterium]